jgi:hypothetical protein
MVSIHWFNPLAHRAYRLYRLDQELACDRDVVSAAPASRQAYGRLLAKASWTGGAIPVCALGRADLIKQRLVALTRPAGLSAGQAMACLTPVALAALLATAPFSVTGIDATASAVSAAILPEAARVPPSDPVSASGSEGSSRRLRDLTRPRSSPTQRPAAPVGDAEELFTAPVLAVEDRTSADYLARRRKAGLLRSRPRLEDPARTARERGRPIFTSSSPEP